MLVTMSESPASASAAPQGATAGPPSSAAGRFGLQPELDERSLVAQAATGNHAAFDQLVTVHQDRIAQLVHRLLGWPGDVDDVVQDVFVDALRNLHRFDGRSSVLTWLTRLTINRCRTHQRKQWLRRLLPLPRVEDPPWRGEGRGERASDATAIRDPADLLIAQETIHQVHSAIRQLNQKDREIIVLRYLEELPIDQIAKTLNLSRTATDVRLTRARQRLEKILQPLLSE
jgi:RNA polymerase sigma-70 factor, ECF subfamily